MPRPCSICAHPELRAIDEALTTPESFRSLAKRFRTTKDALFRHRAHTAAPANPLTAPIPVCPIHGHGAHRFDGGRWLCFRCAGWDGTLAYFRNSEENDG